MNRLPSLLLLALSLAGAIPAAATEVLVGATPGVAAEALHTTLETAGFTCTRDLLHGRVHVVPLVDGETVKDACAVIERLPGVRYCEANGTVRSQALPTDLYYVNQVGTGGQAYLFDINASVAWQTTTGDAANPVVVAVIDSGVDLDHPDLVANLDANGLNVTDCPLSLPGTCPSGDLQCLQCAPAQDDDLSQSHGTHIAGLIGAVWNDEGIAGVNQYVDLLPVKVLSHGEGHVPDVVAGITAAVDAGVEVINASFGVPGQGEQSLCGAVDYAEQNGVIVVAAAGNKPSAGSGRDIDVAPEYPASCTNANLISVTAYDGGAFNDQYFNWGATAVDIAAPGDKIFSTKDGANGAPDSYQILTGTSQSTALVSGAVALLLAHEPTLTVAAVRARILAASDTVAALAGRVSGQRRLNLAKLFTASATTDTDGDGVPDASDNCPTKVNADQADCDSDAIGNACDNTPGCTSDGGGGGGGGCQAAGPVAPGAAWPAVLLLLLPLAVTGLCRLHFPRSRA